MTKGPWLVMDGSTHACTDDLVDLAKRHFSVYANSFGMHVHHVAWGVGEDDARLIAEAPELLEAGKNVLLVIVDHEIGMSVESALALGELKQAIAKAEGNE